MWIENKVKKKKNELDVKEKSIKTDKTVWNSSMNSGDKNVCPIQNWILKKLTTSLYSTTVGWNLGSPANDNSSYDTVDWPDYSVGYSYRDCWSRGRVFASAECPFWPCRIELCWSVSCTFPRLLEMSCRVPPCPKLAWVLLPNAFVVFDNLKWYRDI